MKGKGEAAVASTALRLDSQLDAYTINGIIKEIAELLPKFPPNYFLLESIN